MRVLIVEDDPLLSELVSVKLRRDGFDTNCAFNGVDGLGKMKEYVPEIIILDIMMPIMDGFEFLRIIKSKDETKNIPVILFSSLGEEESNIEEGKRLGADAFLIKSQLSISDVKAKIEEVMNSRK